MNAIKQAETGKVQSSLLMVGDNEAGFFYLKDLLASAADGQITLDHAVSLDDALALLKRVPFDLVLCDYRPGDGLALRLVHEIRKEASAPPVIFLGDHVNGAAIAEAAGTAGGDLNGPMLQRTIRFVVEVYCKERQRQKAEQMLRKLWSAVEQAADLIAITDRAGFIEYVNPAFEELTRYSRQELMGQTLHMIQHAQEGPEVQRQMWDAVLAGRVFRGEVMDKKKDGETFYAERTMAPLRDPDGQITHFVSYDRDITQRRRLEAELMQANKMDAVGRLAGGVAHDFNNLLMVISAYSELMLDALAPDHPLRRNVEQVMGAARRAADLTRQLLGFSRKQIQSLRVLDLDHVVRETCKLLPRLIGEDIQVEFLPGTGLYRVKADPVQIEQILMNLAANARDAMPRGGRLTVETSNTHLDETYAGRRHAAIPAGDYVLLSVTDTGEGVPPEHVEHIFEPFYTTKAEGKGTGLGLATVYGIVKQNGGFIWVYSEAGLGTTFKIYLPRMERPAEVAGRPIVIADISPPGSETVLLVEDEEAVRQSTREFLTLKGYTVLEARNGTDALTVARTHSAPIHLMVTDVVMPQMGGPKLAAELAGERPEMRVLFVSGYAEHTVLRHGPIDVTGNFLQKPFSLEVLAKKVREALRVDILPAEALPAVLSNL